MAYKDNSQCPDAANSILREFGPIFSVSLVSKLCHIGSSLFSVLVFGGFVCVCWVGWLFCCFFPLPISRVSILLMMTWARRPHGIRTRGKNTEVGIPAFRTKDEGTTPVLESQCLITHADSGNVLRPQSVHRQTRPAYPSCACLLSCAADPQAHRAYGDSALPRRCPRGRQDTSPCIIVGPTKDYVSPMTTQQSR